MNKDNKHCYDYPRPAFTVDIVCYAYVAEELKCLLIKRSNNPFKDKWALPGGFVDEDETAEKAAVRELYEETGLKPDNLQLFYIASRPGRDPRGWTISAVFLGFIKHTKAKTNAGDDANEVGWFSLKNAPELAFDHDEIIIKAREFIGRNFSQILTILQLLETNFTIEDIKMLYCNILDSDKSVKRLIIKLLDRNIIISVKNAKLYAINSKVYKMALEQELF